MAQKPKQPLPSCPPKIKLDQINPTLLLGVYYPEVTSFLEYSPQRENSPTVNRVQYQVLVKQACETTIFCITVPSFFWGEGFLILFYVSRNQN